MKFGNDDSVASASHGIVPEHREPPNKVLPERKKSIEEAETSKFQEFKKLIHAATRPLPTETGDGSYIEDETSGGLWADFRALGMKDASTLVSMLENKLSGAFVDDKTMMMEHIIQVLIFFHDRQRHKHTDSFVQLVSRLPDDSKIRFRLTNLFLNELWETLPHPPSTYVSTPGSVLISRTDHLVMSERNTHTGLRTAPIITLHCQLWERPRQNTPEQSVRRPPDRRISQTLA